MTTQKIEYIYDASGVKLRKITTPASGTPTTEDYCGELEFIGNSLNLIHTEEGTVTYDDQGIGTYSYFLKDHLGNTRVVINEAGTVTQKTDYYPFGGTAWSLGNSSGNKYLYNGKELQDDAFDLNGDNIPDVSLDWYDYGARFYDPQIGRFTTQDAFAEKYKRWTPYMYCKDNPINFIDVNGDSTVNISGSQQANAVQQLQASVSSELTLTRNANGDLSYTQISQGNLSIEAQQLANAIDDPTITVNIKAENTKTNYGGAFMGNTVNTIGIPVPILGIAMSANLPVTIVTANQEVNPVVLGSMSRINLKPGADMLHETTEAYQGALISKASGISAMPATPEEVANPNSVYNRSHAAATPQSGIIYRRFFNRQGVELNSVDGATRSTISTSPFLAPIGSRYPNRLVLLQSYP